MCGIAGIWNASQPVDGDVFGKVVNSLARRGPDGRGVKRLDEGRFYMGHRRLSIIDLSDAGNQPMSNEDGSIWLTFNGEIYNYASLRRELEGFGHRFCSRTDSETIIHAFEEWGPDCVQHCRGIFAFAIFDVRQRSLFLARDHIGVKPLYFHRGSESFIFASQPKAILAAEAIPAKIDLQTFTLYLAYGNTPGKSCIYEGIQKLLPGHWLVLKDGKITVNQYWHLQYKPAIYDFDEAVRLIRSKVEDAVCAQAVSDVPVGTLLSGGIDSTIITSLLAKNNKNLPTFTIGFEEKESDESLHASFAAKILETQHHERVLKYIDACQLLPEIIDAYDEPFHLNGLFPYFAVSRLVQSEGIKVVLGGDGADELFAGYVWYELFREVMELRPKPTLWRKLATAFHLRKPVSPLLPVETFFHYNGFLDESAQQSLLGVSLHRNYSMSTYLTLLSHWEPDQTPVLAAQLLDFNCFLVDHCLTKVDRASMACGVEVRVPFLDIELVELVFSIDHDVTFHNGERKALLKYALKDVLPAGMDSTRKKGFSSPLGPWLEKGLATAGRDFLLKGSLCSSGVFESGRLGTTYPQMNSGEQLLLISAELWHRRWIENDADSILHFCDQIEECSTNYASF